MQRLTIMSIPNLPDIRAGDDLTAIIASAIQGCDEMLQGGDVLCIAQKIISKSEGCLVTLADIEPGEEAQDYGTRLNKDPRKVQVVLDQSARVVRAFKHPHQDEGTLICQHHLGHISANAGVDESNLDEEGTVLTLPEDPDASAASLADGLSKRFGAEIGVVITDTFGRPWRLGQVNVAIGLANVPASTREQGKPDGFGRELSVTEPAFADEVAAASGLAMGKADKTPVVLIRGLAWPASDSKASDLIRNESEDMFR